MTPRRSSQSDRSKMWLWCIAHRAWLAGPKGALPHHLLCSQRAGTAGHWHSVGCFERQQAVAHVLMSTALQPFSNGSVMRACNVVRLVRRSRQTHGTPLFPACTSVVHVQTQIPATVCGPTGCSHVCLCPSPTGVQNPPVHLIPQNLVSAVLNK